MAGKQPKMGRKKKKEPQFNPACVCCPACLECGEAFLASYHRDDYGTRRCERNKKRRRSLKAPWARTSM